MNSKTEWHQPKLIRTTIHTGGAELAGGRIVSFPQAGRQGPGPSSGGVELAGRRIASLPQAGGQGPGPRRSARINGS